MSNVPEWAIVTKAEQRILDKREPAPRSKDRMYVERMLLQMCRKLTIKDADRIYLLANSLVHARIKRRLTRNTGVHNAK